MGLDDFSQVTTKASVPGPGSYNLPSDFDSNSRNVNSKAATMKFRLPFSSTELLTGTNSKVGPGTYEVPAKFAVDAPAYSIPQSGMHSSLVNPRSGSPRSGNESPAPAVVSPRQYNMADYPGSPCYTIGQKLPPPAEPGHVVGPGPGVYELPSTLDKRSAPIAFRPLPSQLHRDDQPGPSDYDIARFPDDRERRFPSPLRHGAEQHQQHKQHTFGASLPVKIALTPGPGEYPLPSSFDPPKKAPPLPVVPGASQNVTADAGIDTSGDGGFKNKGRTTFGGRGGGNTRRVNTIGPGPGAYQLPSAMNLSARNGVSISGRTQEYHDMDDVYPQPGPGQYAIKGTSKASSSRAITIAPLPSKHARALTEEDIQQVGVVRKSSDGEFEQGTYHPERAEQYFYNKGPQIRVASVPFKQPTHAEQLRKVIESRKAERHDDDDAPFGKKATRGVRRHKCPFGQVKSDQADLPHKLSSKNPPTFSMAFRTPIAGFLGPADPTIPGPGTYFDADKEAQREAKCAVNFSKCPFTNVGEYAPRVLSVSEKKDVDRASKSMRSSVKGRDGNSSNGADLVFSRKSTPRTPRAPISSPASGIDYYLHKLGGSQSVTNLHRPPGPNHYDDVQAWEKLHSPRSVKLSPRIPHSELPSRISNNTIPQPPK